MTIPSGPLRENLEAIKRAQVVIINGEKNNLFEEKSTTTRIKSKYITLSMFPLIWNS